MTEKQTQRPPENDSPLHTPELPTRESIFAEIRRFRELSEQTPRSEEEQKELNRLGLIDYHVSNLPREEIDRLSDEDLLDLLEFMPPSFKHAAVYQKHKLDTSRQELEAKKAGHTGSLSALESQLPEHLSAQNEYERLARGRDDQLDVVLEAKQRRDEWERRPLAIKALGSIAWKGFRLERTLGRERDILTEWNNSYFEVEANHDPKAVARTEYAISDSKNQIDTLDAEITKQEAEFFATIRTWLLEESGRSAKRRELARLNEHIQQYGDVKDRILNKGHYLFHAVKLFPQVNGNNRRLLLDESGWTDRVDLLLTAPNAHISSSTIQQGDHNRARTATAFSPFGAIINGGKISSAGRGDIATATQQDGSRLTRNHANGHYGSDPIDEYEKNLYAALENPDQNDYNEVVISHPRISALFVNLNNLTDGRGLAEGKLNFDTARMAGEIRLDTVVRKQYGTSETLPYMKDVVTLADLVGCSSDRSLPFFLMIDGTLHETSMENAKGTLSIGETVTPQQVADMEAPDFSNNEAMISRAKRALRDEAKREVFPPAKHAATP